MHSPARPLGAILPVHGSAGRMRQPEHWSRRELERHTVFLSVCFSMLIAALGRQ